MDERDNALLELGLLLKRSDYRFVSVTPESHRRVNARNGNEEGHSLRDAFGWSRPFHARSLPPVVLELLDTAGALERCGTLWRSLVRYSTLADSLYIHSAYPTVESDSVFFGPDSYRFADLVTRTLSLRAQPVHNVIDIGCGTGVGGLVASALLGNQSGTNLILTDINSRALRYAAINAALAGITRLEYVHSDVLASVSGNFDLILSNPPYLADPDARLYRDGGGQLGCDLSERIVRESLPRLAPGGQLVLYTGAPIIGGEDVFWNVIQPLLKDVSARYEYNEIDPDVFGEELDNPGYSATERIAAVSLIVSPR